MDWKHWGIYACARTKEEQQLLDMFPKATELREKHDKTHILKAHEMQHMGEFAHQGFLFETLIMMYDLGFKRGYKAGRASARK